MFTLKRNRDTHSNRSEKTTGFSSTDEPISDRILVTLGITVLLSQLPLVLHLPIWLTLPGLALVAFKMKVAGSRKALLPASATVILILLAVIAVFAHYGYLFGRDPCVAFLFLLLSFKYIETRKNYDASLLIILCAFLLITQFFFKQSLVSAIVSIPSMYFIGLSLFALQRGAANTDTRTMVHITAKLFLQAMPIALLLFVAVPRISQSSWQGAGGDNATTGLSSTMSPGSIASLSKSNEVAFRVEFDQRPPLPQQRYWRGPVLSGFDGHDWFILPGRALHQDGWSAGKQSKQTDKPSIDYTVTMAASHQSWLLALETPVVAPTPVNNSRLGVVVNNELQINTAKPLNQPLRYRASSLLTDRFIPMHPPDRTALITTSTNPRARTFAQELRSRHADDARLANELLMWFHREPFYYTLNPPTLGADSIDDFIFNSRRGFCEHYAGSFVFMLRAAGIPARVVTGYQGGEMNNGYMIVRQSDAHAWAEAYIDDQWIRFDPTAAVAPQRVEQGATDALRGDLSQRLIDRIEIPFVNTLTLKWDAVNFAWQRLVIGFDSNRQDALWKKFGIDKPQGWMIVVALIAAALLWALIILKPLTGYNLKRHSRTDKYWRKLARKLEKRGLQRRKGETVTHYIKRASDRWPEYRVPLQSIGKNYNEARYAEAGSDPYHRRKIAQNMKNALTEIGRLG